jgi:hypothetical protein
VKKVISAVISLLVLTSLAFSFGLTTVNAKNAQTSPMFQNQTGNRLSSDNGVDTDELPSGRTYEPLPFKEEPYVHPSGAFTFGVPESWEVFTEDEVSATITDGSSVVGATFTDVGKVYNDKEMDDFVDAFLTIFFSYVSDDYKIVGRRVLPDDRIFVAVEYKDAERKNNAEFFFEQHDTLVFALLLASPVYEKISPTWNNIIESYAVDPEAAKAISQPAATPTPPAPATPTPAPDNSDYAPQPGRSMVFVGNDYSETLTFTINNTENKVPVGGQAPIDLNPGKYTFTVSIPGGAVNGEVEVGPDQSWAVYVDEHGSVYGPFQVYP